MQMRKQPWRTSLLVACTTVALLGQSAFAYFGDVTASHWANSFIDYLSGRNIITGYPDNTFRPNQSVTRAEFAVMLAKSQNMPTGAGGGAVFTDVPSSHWASQAIQSASNRGWIAGYPGGRFLPNQPISMAEMYAIVSKASGQGQMTDAQVTTILNHFTDASTIPVWARPAVANAAQTGIYVDELAQGRLFPNLPASRASVAATIAKLMNTSFRDPVEVAGGTQQPSTTGEAVNVTGTLQATARPGEWMVVTADGKQYFITNPGTLAQQPWFKVGNQVRLQGNIDTAASTANHQVVQFQSIASVQPTENQVTVTGLLRPSLQTQGAWVIQGNDNKTYRLLNPEQFTSLPAFKFGSNVTVTGNLRPDVQLPTGEGTALVASQVSAAQTTNQVSLKGELRPTVTAGGWTVTDPTTNQKYVLLGEDAAESQSWFKTGSEVMVTGTVRTDIPNIYQEGPVLVVSNIQPSPGAVTGTQQVSLYYPNLINIVRDPALMLGDPTVRVLEGPNIPQKAVEAYLQGPNSVEQLRGYFVDDDIKQLHLSQFNVSADGKATVVLEAPANFQFDNTVIPQRLDEAMNRTLRQFTGVKDVDVAVKGQNNQVIWTSP